MPEWLWSSQLCFRCACRPGHNRRNIVRFPNGMVVYCSVCLAELKRHGKMGTAVILHVAVPAPVEVPNDALFAECL